MCSSDLLWNATRFVLMNLEEDVAMEELNLDTLEEEDRWILSKLNTVVKEATENLNKYEIGMAASKVYDFIWDEYCDWYIEMVKSRLYGEDKASKETAEKVLLHVLKDILKLLHPFMPFITEEIWQHLPGDKNPLILSSWPVNKSELNFSESEEAIEFIKSGIKAIRNARAEMNIVPSRKSKQIFVTMDERVKSILTNGQRYFLNLASADGIELKETKEGIGEDNISVVLDRCEVFLPLKDLIDFEKEIERLGKDKEKLQGEIKRVVGKLSNENFVKKAPEKVVEEEREKQKKYEEMLEKVIERLDSIKSNR